MTEAGADVVCDAGPIIHLDELGCLDLLADFPLVLVPEEVWREVESHRPGALEQGQSLLDVAAAPRPSDPALCSLVEALALDRGEQAALSLARQRGASLLLTDDSAARLAARALAIRVHGTIGVLTRAIRREQRTRERVLELLKDLPALSTLHIRQSLLEEIIRNVEQY